MLEILDYIIITIIILGTIFGFMKGFVKIFVSWFSAFLGILAAFNWSGRIIELFLPQYANNMVVLFIIGVILFTVFFILFSLIGHGFRDMLHNMNLGVLDYILGGVFGAAQTLLLTGWILYWAVNFKWISLGSFPIASFSVYWAEKIIRLFITYLPFLKNLL